MPPRLGHPTWATAASPLVAATPYSTPRRPRGIRLCSAARPGTASPRGVSPLDPAGGLSPAISRLLLALSITTASGRRLEPRPFGLKGPTRERLSGLLTERGGAGCRCLCGTQAGRRLAGQTPHRGSAPLGWRGGDEEERSPRGGPCLGQPGWHLRRGSLPGGRGGAGAAATAHA